MRELPTGRRPALLLELLPKGLVMSAEEALSQPRLRLVDGRLLHDVYTEPIQELHQRRGLLAGAWIDGNPQDRDQDAAEQWLQLSQRYPQFHWILSFGDWHLAEDHLPKQLRHHGAHPVVLHQSPEPLWERWGSRVEEAVLELPNGHWAWLHTPPLTLRASALLDRPGADQDLLAELTEDICESLAAELATVLDLPPPLSRPAIWSYPHWREFHSKLPLPDRQAFSADHPPRVLVTHPYQPFYWLDREPTFNGLMECACHALVCDWPLGERHDLIGRVRARAFRRLWAVLLNPFLRPPSAQNVAQRLFPHIPNSRQASELERGPQILREANSVTAEAKILAVEVFGARLGTHLAKDSRLNLSFVLDFLDTAGENLGWEEIATSIAVG